MKVSIVTPILCLTSLRGHQILVEAGKPDIAIGQPVAIMTETPVETAVFEGYLNGAVHAVGQEIEQEAPSTIPAIEEHSSSAAVAPATKPEVETVPAASSITPAWEGSYEDIELTKYRKVRIFFGRSVLFLQ